MKHLDSILFFSETQTNLHGILYFRVSNELLCSKIILKFIIYKLSQEPDMHTMHLMLYSVLQEHSPETG